jgi:hypothetical protein
MGSWERKTLCQARFCKEIHPHAKQQTVDGGVKVLRGGDALVIVDAVYNVGRDPRQERVKGRKVVANLDTLSSQPLPRILLLLWELIRQGCTSRGNQGPGFNQAQQGSGL